MVAKGYTQREDIDFIETFSPVFTKDSFRLIMALVAYFSKHMEIKYLTVNDLVKKGDIVIEHIRTESMLVDPLTKGLKPITLKWLK